MAGSGTAADLAVLDYMSQRLLDEAARLGQLLDGCGVSLPQEGGVPLPKLTDGASQAVRRLERLAREQVLARQHHFTGSLFLESDHCPSDEADAVQWAVSLQRINLATFVALVLLPQVTVTELVSWSLPNREQRVCSLGLESAAKGFFAHVVPVVQRGVATVSLLVDMQTQQWLMAARNEDHLQSMVAEERDLGDAAIRKLLALEPAGAIDGDDGDDLFEDTGVGIYRSEMNRRLNKITGGKLAAVRMQYTLADIWKRVIQLSGECAAALALPTIMSSILASRNEVAVAADAGSDEAEDSDVEAEDSDVEAEDGEEDEEHSSERDEANVGNGVPGAAASAADSGSDAASRAGETTVARSASRGAESDVSLDGSFEVTIFQDPDRSRSGARAPPEASEQLDDQAGETPDGYESSGEASSIDPSFLEERRIAVVLRDALDDVHLETLIENIDAEHIDIGAQRTPQARTPRRMHIRREPADDFRLQFDDAASDVEPEDGGGGGVPERAPIKRRRVRYGQQQQPIHRGRGNELGGNSSEDDFRPMPSGAASDAESGGGREGASEMIRVLLEPKVPDDRRLAHYEQQQQQPVDWERRGKFRGRRGIRAEDPSLLRGADNSRPVEFTPSPRGSPGPGQPEPEDAGQEGTAHAMLGQYAPRPTDRDPTSSPAQPQPQRGSSSPPSGARRPRRNQRWTDDEEECFIRAVFKHGPQWARILECHGREGCDDTVLRKRTRYNLKDKARTIKLRLLREGRPLGPFVNATGHL